MTVLGQMRRELEEFNVAYFELIERRKNLVQKLQKEKFQYGGPGYELAIFKNFDSHREKELFLFFSHSLKNSTLEEILSFSLLMESHATQGLNSYPAWSQKIHIEKTYLTSTQFKLAEMVNPLLLNVTFPKLCSQIELVPRFASLL